MAFDWEVILTISWFALWFFFSSGNFYVSQSAG